MVEKAPPRNPWSQPPLFEPPWILIELRLNVISTDGTMWGGLSVSDGETDELLMSTAQAFSQGLDGLKAGVQQLLSIAADHLENGAPFPPA